MTLFADQLEPSPSMRRWFGGSLCVLLLLVAAACKPLSTPGAVFVACLGLVQVAVYYILPATQLHIIQGWRIVTFPLAWLVSHLLLASVFILVLTPMGLALRFIKRDPLQLRKGNGTTNWRERQVKREIQRYFKQF